VCVCVRTEKKTTHDDRGHCHQVQRGEHVVQR